MAKGDGKASHAFHGASLRLRPLRLSGSFKMIPTKTFWEEFLEETQDSEKEYVRYLSKNIASLKELREEYRDDWEMEMLISNCIFDESNLMNDCKRSWLNVQRGKKELEGIRRSRSDNQQPGDGTPTGPGNVFMDKSQVPDAES